MSDEPPSAYHALPPPRRTARRLRQHHDRKPEVRLDTANRLRRAHRHRARRRSANSSQPGSRYPTPCPPDRAGLARRTGTSSSRQKSGLTRCQLSTAEVDCESVFTNAPEGQRGDRERCPGHRRWNCPGVGNLVHPDRHDRLSDVLGGGLDDPRRRRGTFHQRRHRPRDVRLDHGRKRSDPVLIKRRGTSHADGVYGWASWTSGIRRTAAGCHLRRPARAAPGRQKTRLLGVFRSTITWPWPTTARPTDSWVTLRGIARETSTIRLGTMVTSATFRYP